MRLQRKHLVLLLVGVLLVAAVSATAIVVWKKGHPSSALSPGSANIIKKARQTFMVEAYVTRGLPKLDTFVRDLGALLSDYKAASEGKLDFTMLEVKGEDAASSTARERAKDAGLIERKYLTAAENTASVVEGFMGLVLHYGADQDVIDNLVQNPSDPSANGLEFWISNKLREMRDKGDGVEHKIGVLVGHDDIRLTDKNLLPTQPTDPLQPASVQAILLGVFKYLKIVDVDLGSTPEVDPSLDGLIITQPGKDYTEDELKKVDAFVLRGKSLVVVAGAANMKAGDPQMTATLNLHGLDKLLSGYGLALGKDVVIDPGNAMKIAMRTTDGASHDIVFPQFLVLPARAGQSPDQEILDTAFAPFFRLNRLQIPFASTITIQSEKQPEAKFAVRARTSEQAGRITENGALSPFEPNAKLRVFPKPRAGEQENVAVSVTGTLRSAFDSSVKGAKPSVVLLISSPQFFANPLARAAASAEPAIAGMHMPPDHQLTPLAYQYLQQGFDQQILSMRNLIDWMSGDEDLAAVSATLGKEPARKSP